MERLLRVRLRAAPDAGVADELGLVAGELVAARVKGRVLARRAAKAANAFVGEGEAEGGAGGARLDEVDAALRRR